MVLTGDADLAPVSLVLAVPAGVLGAVCGVIARFVLDGDHGWGAAAVTSAGAAVVAVAGGTLLVSEGRLMDNPAGALAVALPSPAALRSSPPGSHG